MNYARSTLCSPWGWWKMQSNRPRPSHMLSDVLRERLQSHGLTCREEQIVELILYGLSNKAIATGCRITEQTVKDHLKHVYRKMGVHQRTAVIAKLLQFSPAILRQPSAQDAAKGSGGAQRVSRRVNQELEVGRRC